MVSTYVGNVPSTVVLQLGGQHLAEKRHSLGYHHQTWRQHKQCNATVYPDPSILQHMRYVQSVHKHNSVRSYSLLWPRNKTATWASSRGSSSSSKATAAFFFPAFLPMHPRSSCGSAKGKAPRPEFPPPDCASIIGGSDILAFKKIYMTHIIGSSGGHPSWSLARCRFWEDTRCSVRMTGGVKSENADEAEDLNIYFVLL